MSTVAYRAGIIASDSLNVRNQTIRLASVHRKIWRLKDSTLVGGVGDTHELIQTMSGASNLPTMKLLDKFSSSSILCVQPNGTMWVNEKGIWMGLESPEFYAIGSGAAVALGALNHGATAEEAIKAAAISDIYTDNRIQTLTFSGEEVLPPIPTINKEIKKYWQFWKG